MDDPSLGGEEVANPEDALYKTYSKTIRAAEKALVNAKEGGFDPSLRKPRKSRQSSLLSPQLHTGVQSSSVLQLSALYHLQVYQHAFRKASCMPLKTRCFWIL